MKKTVIVFSFALISILFHSCSTDFSTVAPYKETMVVYGLINPHDSVQYVRVSKAYLGEGNSLIMAQQKDSVNYADVLDVKMQRLLNGAAIQTVQLQRDTGILKNPGLFNNPYQVVYKTTNQILMDGSAYKLIVHNNQSGLTATSVTNVIDDISNFLPNNIDNPSFPMDFISNIPYKITFDPPSRNGWVYNITIRFHYKEVNLTTNDTTLKYVDWILGDQVTSGSLSPVSFSQIYRIDLYRIVGNAITPADTTVIRRVIDSFPIELMFTAGTEDLYTYQQVTQPSQGIVQERPLFTNIDNGVGLFTCRYSKSIFKTLNAPSRAAFDTSAYTRNIHFQ
jgi:hypothetical protein